MAGKPETEIDIEKNRHLANQKTKSPNWDSCNKLLKTHTVGQRIEGWPFNEGFPKNRQGSFKIILLDGQTATATIDLSTQYRAEGVQWKTKGNTWGTQQVAAWQEI